LIVVVVLFIIYNKRKYVNVVQDIKYIEQWLHKITLNQTQLQTCGIDNNKKPNTSYFILEI